LGYVPVEDPDILNNPGKTAAVAGMAQQSPPSGIVYRVVRRLAVAPLIRRPKFKAPFGEGRRETAVPEGMFRHTVDQVN
jgi:hypothetical protein